MIPVLLLQAILFPGVWSSPRTADAGWVLGSPGPDLYQVRKSGYTVPGTENGHV